MPQIRPLRMFLSVLLICHVFSSSGLLAEEVPSAVGPLMKLFQSGRLPAERQPTVVEMICKRGNEHDLQVVFDKIVKPEGFPPELRVKAMQWMAEAATTRKIKPVGDLSPLEKLVVGAAAAADPGAQQAAIRLASIWKDTSIAPALQKLARDESTRAELRRVAIEGLVAIGNEDSRTTLHQLVGKEHSLPVRMQAAAGLAGMDLEAACQAAAEILSDASAQTPPDEVLAAILDRKNGSDLLASAIQTRILSSDVAKRSLRYMYSIGRSDGALSSVLSKSAGIAADVAPPTQEEVAAIAADVMARGDAARGEAIFRRKDLSCMTCHSISRAGGQVGPELSAVGGSSPIDYVVNSILNPNLAVKEQFVTRIFELADGRVLTGVVIDRDDQTTNIRDANGKVVKIPAADIEEEIEGKSLMPQGLTKFLTHEELLDLVRFVSELGKPGPFAVNQAKTIQRWRVLRTPPVELTQAIPHLEHLRQFVQGSQSSDWDPVYGRVAGVLPLEDLRSPDRPVLILQGEILVNSPGKVRIEITSTEKIQAWFDTQEFDARSFEVDLTPGQHQLTLRVENTTQIAPSIRVEFSTPGDSSANYQVIGGP